MLLWWMEGDFTNKRGFEIWSSTHTFSFLVFFLSFLFVCVILFILLLSFMLFKSISSLDSSVPDLLISPCLYVYKLCIWTASAYMLTMSYSPSFIWSRNVPLSFALVLSRSLLVPGCVCLFSLFPRGSFFVTAPIFYTRISRQKCANDITKHNHFFLISLKQPGFPNCPFGWHFACELNLKGVVAWHFSRLISVVMWRVSLYKVCPL